MTLLELQTDVSVQIIANSMGFGLADSPHVQADFRHIQWAKSTTKLGCTYNCEQNSTLSIMDYFLLSSFQPQIQLSWTELALIS